MVLGSLSQMTQDDFNFQARAFWHPGRVLEVHLVPRGHGLTGSAAGFHALAAAVEWLVGAWAEGPADAPVAAAAPVHVHWLADFNLGNSHRIYGWRIPMAARTAAVQVEVGKIEYHHWFPAYAVHAGAGRAQDLYAPLRTRGTRLPVLVVHKRTPEDEFAHHWSDMHNGPEPKRFSKGSAAALRAKGGVFARLAKAAKVVRKQLYEVDTPSAAQLTALERLNQKEVEVYAGQAREYGAFVVP